MKTEELLLKLSKKFPSPQYAFLSQVRNQTGYSQNVGKVRTADALALGLWKSRGHHLHGFELKISRSDWLHELKDPSKAEAIAKYCDMFSLVISEEKIIDISEVPKTWGILVIKNGTIKTIREAPLLESKSMDRAFLCGFMRNVSEQQDKNFIPRADFDSQVEKSVKNGLGHHTREISRKAEKYELLMKKLEKFEKESGLNLAKLSWGWTDPTELGDAVKQVMDGKHKRIKDELERLLDTAKRIVKSTRSEIKKMEEEK